MTPAKLEGATEHLAPVNIGKPPFRGLFLRDFRGRLLLWEQEVARSNRAAPTNFLNPSPLVPNLSHKKG